MSEEPQEPEYREVRRWCIQEARPLTPADLQRRFRVDYYRAAQLLEELEEDLVLRRRADGAYDTATGLSVRKRSGCGRLQRDRGLFHQKRSADETCECCGWALPPGIHARRRSGVHAHHVVPVIAGGSDFPDNRLLLCPNCHCLAHALFPLIGGVYAGPRTREGLLQSLRFAEADPRAYVAERVSAASSLLPWNAAPPPAAPPRGPPPVRRLLPASRVTPLIQRLHLREKHGGPIFDCPTCAERARGVGSDVADGQPGRT
jgi:HNH endonuclease